MPDAIPVLSAISIDIVSEIRGATSRICRGATKKLLMVFCPMRAFLSDCFSMRVPVWEPNRQPCGGNTFRTVAAVRRRTPSP